MKRLKLSAIAACLLAGTAFADEWYDSSTGYTWTYQINGETAEIGNIYPYNGVMAISPSPEGAVTVPSTLGDRPVTSIGNSAFSGCSGLTSVTIPNNVTSIGSYAFNGCENLETLVLPNSVTNIEGWAFEGCTGLRSVTVPECILGQYQGLFEYFSNHGSWGSREKFENLTEVIIADGVTYLSNSAFDGYSYQLARISIPASVTHMDIRFDDGWDPSLEVNIAPENPVYKFIDGMLIAHNGPPFYSGETVVVDGALASGDVTIPDGVTRIAAAAFRRMGGYSITSVAIPDSVTSIGSAAFDSRGIINVTIGTGVTNIEKCVFGGYINGWLGSCELTSISVAPGNSAYSSVNGMLLSKDGKTLVQGINGDVVVPNGVTSIGPYAFSCCSGLTSVTLPSSVTNIEDGAFMSCDGLTGAFAIPAGVTSIGYQAFEYCYGLTSVEIPDSVTSIGEYAFEYCNGLTSVVIPDSVTSIGYAAFRECENLGSVVIGRRVARIGSDAFRECGKLGKVTFRGNEPRFADSDDSEEGYSYQFYGVAPYCTVYLPRTATFNADAGGGWCGMKAEYYDLEEDVPVTPGPVTPDPVTPTPVTPDPENPGYEVIDAKDITAPYEAAKAVVLHGAVYDGADVAGIVELKLAKVNAKKKSSKVSGAVTGLNGKKYTIKAVPVTEIDGTTPKTVSLSVKNLGTMTVTIGGGDFAGSLGDLHVQSAAVGGAWGGSDATVSVAADDLSMFTGRVLDELMPYEETAGVRGGKWVFAKAAKVKWAKPKATDETLVKDESSGKGLVVDTSRGCTNLSGIKLTYTPKKGLFKGNCKVYELQGSGAKTKLKKYTVKVSGVVVEGKGFGEVICTKPALSWSVSVR